MVASRAASLAATVVEHSADVDARSEPGTLGDAVAQARLPARGRGEFASWLARIRGAVVAGAEWVAFWLAIVLPFVTLTFLANGISTSGELTAIGWLLVANVVALVVGQNHRRH